MRQRVRLFFCLAILFSGLYAFPPKSFTEYRNNCLRLLKDNKYTFLGQYFSRYSRRYEKEKKIYKLALDIVLGVPKLTVKTNVISACLRTKGSDADKSTLLYEYGRILYFEGELEQAEARFRRSGHPKAQFYMAQIYYRQQKYATAERYFRRFLANRRKGSILRKKSCLAVANICLKRGDFQEAYKYALKSDYQSVDRAILLYRIYQSSGEREKMARILKTIKNRYKDHPKTSLFLAEIR